MYQLLGGESSDGTVQRSVLEYNRNTTEWKLVGEMKEGRDWHAISTVPLHKIVDYCF